MNEIQVKYEDEDEDEVPTREELRAWWHETLDLLMEQGYTPVTFIMDNASGNRVGIGYMPPEPHEES